MKTRPLPHLIGMLTFTALVIPSLHAEPTPAQRANAAFIQAVALENAGDAAKAKAAYETALRLNPRHAKAEFRLGQLRINYDKVIAEGQRKKISAVMIPEFRVKDAEFSEALTALAILTEKSSKGAVTPNYIIQDPTNSIATRKVNLVMKNAPSGELLKYMLQMVGAKVRYDQHAVVILPR